MYMEKSRIEVVGATSSAMLECGKKACLIPPTVSEMPVCGHNPGSAYFVPYYGDRLYEAECVYLCCITQKLSH